MYRQETSRKCFNIRDLRLGDRLYIEEELVLCVRKKQTKEDHYVIMVCICSYKPGIADIASIPDEVARSRRM